MAENNSYQSSSPAEAFDLKRYFLINTAAVIALSSLLVYVGIVSLLRFVIVSESERSSVSRAIKLYQLIAMEIEHQLDLTGVDVQVTSSNFIADMDRIVSKYAEGSDTFKVVIYNADIRILYSTAHEDIGRVQTLQGLLLKAMSGEVVSKYESGEGQKSGNHLAGKWVAHYVETYVPVSHYGSRARTLDEFAVFEIYRDVTPMIDNTRWIPSTLAAAVAGFFLLILLSQLAIVNKAAALIAQSAREMEVSELRYRHLFDTIAEGLYRTDMDGCITEINRAAAKIFGYDVSQDIIGYKFNDLMASANFDASLPMAAIKVKLRSGKEFWLNYSAQQVADPLQEGGYLVEGTVNDITDKVLIAQKLKQKEDALQNDLKTARDVQQAIIRGRLPSFSGIGIGASYIPAGLVGGDCYRFYNISEGKQIGLLIFDVCGHGVASALINLMFLYLFPRDWRMSPGEILSEVNRRYIGEIGTDYFLTMVYIQIDLELNTIHYANAGHPHPVISHANHWGIDILDKNELFIGFDADHKYNTFSYPFMPGDRLFAFTDAIIESSSSNRVFFTEEQLYELIQDSQGEPIEGLPDKFYNRVLAHTGQSELDDDYTVVAVEFLDQCEK